MAKREKALIWGEKNILKELTFRKARLEKKRGSFDKKKGNSRPGDWGRKTERKETKTGKRVRDGEGLKRYRKRGESVLSLDKTSKIKGGKERKSRRRKCQ